MTFKIKNVRCDSLPVMCQHSASDGIVTVLEFRNLMYMPIAIKSDIYLIRYNECCSVQFDITTLHHVSVVKCKPSKSTKRQRSWVRTSIEDELNNKLGFFSSVLPYYEDNKLYMMFLSDNTDEHTWLILPVFIDECGLVDINEIKSISVKSSN